MQNLNKPVGKNCFINDETSTKYVQISLKGVKGKNNKPYFKGYDDGKQSKELIAAIEQFQSDNGLSVTGKIECSGPTLTKLNLKTPQAYKTYSPIAITNQQWAIILIY